MLAGPPPTRGRRRFAVAAMAVAVVAVAVAAYAWNGDPGGAAGDCPTSLPRTLVDDERGMSLCLPENWREILADDAAAWLELYDGRESDAERWVRDGSMDHFAVPLEPRDADLLVNLAVYSEPVSAETSLAELRDAYISVLVSVGSEVEVSSFVTLEAGPAVLIEGEKVRSSGGTLVVDRFLDWIVVHGDTAYYVLFASDRTFAGDYRSTFEAIANSVRFEDRPAST
ncbi:MAG: hypothetical protein L0227_05380 [Chloroflexi bacterium]|nr:hypothetical protein [Chloroflexota bacterium]